MRPDEESGADFAGRYAAMSEAELMLLAREYESLVEASQVALRREFAGRGLEPPLVQVAEAEGGFLRLVTVRRYRDLSEAIVARSLMEAGGIFAELRDENYVRMEWQISNFIGGIRLQVDERDAAEAVELLDQQAPEVIAFGGGEEFAQPRCPVCGSREIRFEGASRAASISGLYLLALPLPAGRESWVCVSCGARFGEPSKEY